MTERFFAKEREYRRPDYCGMFWLFIVGSVLGVIIEGVWYVLMHNRWETHVVSIWGPFCIIYGLGAVGYYIGNYALRRRRLWLKFAVFAMIGDAVELICGLVLRYGLNMRAWTYESYFMNFKGIICLKMTVIWGIAGVLFGFLIPYIDRLLVLTQGNIMLYVCIAFSAFMAVDFFLTGVCLVRWTQRRSGVPASNRLEQWADENYDDDYMKDRFVEWRFLS